jgi:hypothetical protein
MSEDVEKELAAISAAIASPFGLGKNSTTCEQVALFLPARPSPKIGVEPFGATNAEPRPAAGHKALPK